MKPSRFAPLVPILLFSFSSTADAQQSNTHHHLTQFDVPQATKSNITGCSASCGTFAEANNDEGLIVGYYTDEQIATHAFFRTPDAHIESFDVPPIDSNANLATYAFSVNDCGAITGTFENSNSVFVAFIREPDGKFTNFAFLGPDGLPEPNGTEAFDINLEGTTAGIYFDTTGEEHGFVRSRYGNVSTFDPIGSVATMVCEETCLNAYGAITGFFLDSTNTWHGFLREPSGKIITFDAPKAATGSGFGTFPASINLDGTITGYIVNSKNVSYGFLRTPQGRFSIFSVSDASTANGAGIAPYSINFSGAVAGAYYDDKLAAHAFVRWHNGDVTTFSASNANDSTPYQGTRPSTNNASGQVTGWILDKNNLNHAFLWCP